MNFSSFFFFFFFFRDAYTFIIIQPIIFIPLGNSSPGNPNPIYRQILVFNILVFYLDRRRRKSHLQKRLGDQATGYSSCVTHAAAAIIMLLFAQRREIRIMM